MLNSPVGLGLHTFTAEGTGSIPGWETKIPQAAWCAQKKKKNPHWIQERYLYTYVHISIIHNSQKVAIDW